MSDNLEKAINEAAVVRQLPPFKLTYIDEPVKGTFDPASPLSEQITWRCPQCGTETRKSSTGHYKGQLTTTPIQCFCGAVYKLQTQT